MKVSRLLAGGLTALVLPLVALTSVPAQADSSEAPVSAAWLAAKIQDDGLLHTEWGADYGLSADALLTLDAIGGHASDVSSIADALGTNPEGYISGGDWDVEGSTYAGATGKLTFTLNSVGRNVRSTAGIDLVERLEARVVTEGANTGRALDFSDYGDFSNGVGQAWVTRALIATDSELADEALGYVLGKQCSDGGFPTNLNENGCTAGHDTTAYTIFALNEAKAAGTADAAVLDTAISKAVASLKTAQASDGSFGAGDGINSNTTGLAAWALRANGETAAADKGVEWIRTVYAAPAGALAAEAGAIAFNVDAFASAQSAGQISSDALDQWTRATAQAALAWLGASDPAPAPEEPNITINAPTSVTAGEPFTISASGYPEGEVVTVDLSINGSVAGKSFSGFKFAVLGTETADASGTITHTATAPTAAGDYTLSLMSDSGLFTAPINIEAAASSDSEDDDAVADDTSDEVTAAAADLSRTDGTVAGGIVAAAAVLLLAGVLVTIVALRRWA